MSKTRNPDLNTIEDLGEPFKTNIGGTHLFAEAPLTGFYHQGEDYPDLVVKQDPRTDRNMIEVFAANFMKGLMQKLCESGEELIADTGFIRASNKDDNSKPYVYSSRFEGNVLFKDAIAALAVKAENDREADTLLSDNNNKIPNKPYWPFWPTPAINYWLEKKPDRYNLEYIPLVATSLFLGDADINAGNFFVVPKDKGLGAVTAVFDSKSDNENQKIFEVYDDNNVRVTRFDFGGIRGLTGTTILNPLDGILHYTPLNGAPFWFATFPSSIRNNPNLYSILARISQLTTRNLKNIISPAVDKLQGYCTAPDLIDFIKAQGLPAEIDEQDTEATLLKKIKKAFLYIYTARKISCRYQTLEYLLTLSDSDRKKFNRQNNFLHDVSDENIQRLIKQDKANFYSTELTLKRQYKIYKSTIYKEDIELIGKEKIDISKQEKVEIESIINEKIDISKQEKDETSTIKIYLKDEENLDSIKKPYESFENMQKWLNKKIAKYNDKLLDDLATKYTDRLDELKEELTTDNVQTIYYRYHLAKYIYERKMQDKREGQMHSFFRGIIGFDAGVKIKTAEKIDNALKNGEKVDLELNEYQASQEGNLGDINQKFSRIYTKYVTSSQNENKKHEMHRHWER